jgi:hypothetical protein
MGNWCKKFSVSQERVNVIRVPVERHESKIPIIETNIGLFSEIRSF